jgi:hypothetical protein
MTKSLADIVVEATPGPWFANDHNTMAERLGVSADEWLGYAWVGFGGNADGSFQGKLADLDRRRDGHNPFRERAAADAQLIALAPTLATLVLEAREKGRALFPDSLGITNPNISDDQIVPIDFTMGEVRAFAATLAKLESL